MIKKCSAVRPTIVLKFNYTKSVTLLLFTFIFLTSFADAQSLAFNSETLHTTEKIEPPMELTQPVKLDFIEIDSSNQTTKPNLLPKNISFLENGLWGERGLFRTVGLAPELTIESRKSELGLRRTMLSVHQIGGFTTLGLMLATCYYGQKIIDGGVYGRRDFENTKKILARATVISYSITGLLSILSPPPMIRRDEVSTTSIHKTLAWLHVTGMILTPILANSITKHRQFHLDKARVHQVAGYITTAIFASAMIVITF